MLGVGPETGPGPVSFVYLLLQACEEKTCYSARLPAGKASRTRPPQGGLQHDFKTRCRDAWFPVRWGACCRKAL